MRWRCLYCSAEFDRRPPTCGNCLRFDLLAPLPALCASSRELAVAPGKRQGVIRACDLPTEFKPAWYGEPYASAWRLGDPHAVQLVGPAGQGKSTLATKMAVNAAPHVEVLYVASEERHSREVRDRLSRSGMDDYTSRRIHVSNARTVPELLYDLGRYSSVPLVIIDSLTVLLSRRRAHLEEIVAALEGRSWIALTQINSRGRSLGGPGVGHTVDVIIPVKNGLAEVEKNRFGGMRPVQIWETREAACSKEAA